MTHDAITLYHAVGACSSVTRRALDRTGLSYDIHGIDLALGEQRGPEYLAINPAGRVPALKVGERVLTENPAILTYLDTMVPAAGLMPKTVDPLQRAQDVAQLLWCSATLHPALRHIRAPARFTTGDTEPVVEKGLEAFVALAETADRRLAATGHWLGADWSILDTYVAWAFAVGTMAGFDAQTFPHLARLIAVEDPLA